MNHELTIDELCEISGGTTKPTCAQTAATMQALNSMGTVLHAMGDLQGSAYVYGLSIGFGAGSGCTSGPRPA